jgi:hypothetical protein
MANVDTQNSKKPVAVPGVRHRFKSRPKGWNRMFEVSSILRLGCVKGEYSHEQEREQRRPYDHEFENNAVAQVRGGRTCDSR